MNVFRYRDEDGTSRVGVRRGDSFVDAPFGDLLELIAAGADGIQRLGEAEEEIRKPEHMLAPIDRPGKIFGSGINYESHGAEIPDGAWLPAEPFFFSKLPTAVVGPNDPIVLPRSGLQVDWEVELAVIIGKEAQMVTQEEAMNHVFGYTLMNDVSSRAIQFTEEQPGDRQITLGKGIDTFAPLGPEIVLHEDGFDPGRFRVKSYVNGEKFQDESVSKLRFDVPHMISWLSGLVTLEPGDVISTGTPGGCGTFLRPPRFLQPGDSVTISEESIGELTNPVVAGPAYDGEPWPRQWTPPE